MPAWLKSIDKKLLPPSEENRLAPYIWLVYLFIFYVGLVFLTDAPHKILVGTGATIVFLGLYFNGYWQCGYKVSWNILGIALLGSYLATITPGSSVFFVFAGAFCCRLGNPKKAIAGLAILSLWIGLLSWWVSLGPYFYLPAIMFTLMIGGVNIYQAEIEKKRRELKLSQDEVKTLARTAERERIARDLHDLIGHTFSVITLKAELARKLVDKDLDKAKDEMEQLENISRDALKQVREVVTGFRSTDLNSELAHAKYVFESNDIHFGYRCDDIDSDESLVSESLNKELAIVLKELVTNILKHSGATQVKAEINLEEQSLIMKVHDNGKGFEEQKNVGFGLKGIAERLDKFNGSLKIASSSGAEVSILIPLEK